MVQWRPENGTRIGVHAPARARPTRCAGSRSTRATSSTSGTAGSTGDRIEFSGTRFEHPDFGIDASAPLDESAGDDDAALPGPLLGRPRRRTRPAGSRPTTSAATSPVQRRLRRRALPLPLHVGGRRPGPSARRLRQHREVRRRHRRAPDLERRADRPRRRERVRPRPAGRRRGRRLAASTPSTTSATDRTDVCVLDARDVAAGPIARVHLTQRMPFGFHANWFAAD